MLKLNTGIYPLKTIFIKYIFILFIAYLIALLAAPQLWAKNVYLMHTVIELACIFAAVSTFLIIWNTYQKPVSEYQLIGFGFLAVAVFDVFHTYYFIGTNLLGQGYPRLSAKYWILGRLAEAAVLAVISMRRGNLRINKWIALFAVLNLSIGLSIAVLIFPGLMPDMMTSDGPTTAKYIAEYTVIILSIISLYNISHNLEGEATISYEYLFMGLLFVIPAELSFTMYNEITAFHNTFGHVLKIISYYFFYKAVFVSNIEYPHKKLALANAELSRTNEQIKDMGAVLNETLDALPIGILYYEPDSRIKYMNKRLEEILDCNRNDFYGLTAEEFLKIFPIIEHEEKDIFQLTGESETTPVNTVRTYRKLNGEYVKLSLTSQNIRIGMLVYFNEVKKEQELSNFHLQTRTILNAVSNCVMLIDMNERIILANKAFQKVFEADETELIGMHMNEFGKITGLDTCELAELLFKGEGSDKPYEVSVNTFKGSRRDLMTYITLIKNIDDEIIAAIGISTDITDTKQQRHNIEQQDKLALIGQMAAGIVHEIKNPLSTIKGLSQLIKVKAKTDKVKEYSEIIDNSIDDVTKVVNEFLNFSKPRPPVKMRTSIKSIVESMQLITETQCFTKNIKSRFHYSSFDMEITADEIKIKQVILNMTENAIAAMEGVENPELIISTSYDAEAKEGIISIKDNGKGMSPEILAKLGSPFFTTKERGTGLGLGICYQIMHEHNGRIEARSTEGSGTEFLIIFTQIEDLI